MRMSTHVVEIKFIISLCEGGQSFIRELGQAIIVIYMCRVTITTYAIGGGLHRIKEQDGDGESMSEIDTRCT
jgi:hypothetical protein